MSTRADGGSLRQPHKTHAWEDLREPAVARAAARLRRFLWTEFTLRGRGVAINGIHRFRWRIRPLKMWEYARGWVAAPVGAGQRLLDFGGGGTLPPAYAAAQGAAVHIVDIDETLLARSRAWAARRARRLETASVDLGAPGSSWPDDWPVGAFDAIHSYCVLEHIPWAAQRRILPRLVQALAPGGRLVLTFEYGEQAPGEAPWRGRAALDEMLALLREAGATPLDPPDFVDAGHREVLDRRHPEAAFAFGMLVLERRPSVS